MSEESVNRKKIVRPEKRDVFLFVAWTIKELSYDAQTKCGCVITNKENRIIGTGYNSFPRLVDNEKLPNVRPDKYPWMAHAERNAIANLALNPRDNGGARAYVTGPCCFPCVYAMWQHGIDEIYYMKNGSNAVCVKDGEDGVLIERLVGLLDGQLSYIGVNADFSFMKDPICDLKQKGFFQTELEQCAKLIRNQYGSQD